MASIEAVQRRRDARRLLRELRERAGKAARSAGADGVARPVVNGDGWRERIQREREAAARLARRFFPSKGTGVVDCPLIALDYRYWQARRAGIDVLCRTFWDGASDPRETEAWSFWSGLHYETRAALCAGRRSRVTRGR